MYSERGYGGLRDVFKGGVDIGLKELSSESRLHIQLGFHQLSDYRPPMENLLETTRLS